MMNLIKWVIILVFIFTFVFFRSNTWQVHNLVEDRGGIEYYSAKHSIHWDRFFDYIKTAPLNFWKFLVKR